LATTFTLPDIGEQLLGVVVAPSEHTNVAEQGGFVVADSSGGQ